MDALIWNLWEKEDGPEEEIIYFEDVGAARSHFKWERYKHLTTLCETKLFVAIDDKRFTLEDRWKKQK